MIEIGRRGFLKIILASSIAPAIVRSSSLMAGSGILIPDRHIVLPSVELPTAAEMQAILGPGWRSAAPSWSDIKAGKTRVVFYNGVRFHAYTFV